MGNGVNERKKLNKKRQALVLQAFIKRHMYEFTSKTANYANV